LSIPNTHVIIIVIYFTALQDASIDLKFLMTFALNQVVTIPLTSPIPFFTH